MRCSPLLMSALALLATAGIAPDATAAWPHDPALNVTLCTATGNQLGPVLISDGAGGSIVTWYDARGGAYDIYAQRISAAGVPQWAVNGVAICTAANDQTFPAIASDGAGGAIITWSDVRSGSAEDIYAQRVNDAGAPQWTANGVAVCAATGQQAAPTIVVDGIGGAVITWQDLRGGVTNDIYAQRLNAAGAAQWTANGAAVCLAANSQTVPVIAADGTGGAFITWQDLRSGVANDIYAQRMSAAGARLWGTDGTSISTAVNSQVSPVIISDGMDGAVIAWTDNRTLTLDIYAQRVSASGSGLWAFNGFPVCAAANIQQSPALVADGTGGAIIAWADSRTPATLADIYAQHVGEAGLALWGTDGQVICNAVGDQMLPTASPDGYGGAFLAWTDLRGSARDIYAQHVTATSTPLLVGNGMALSIASRDQDTPVSVSDGSGGLIVVWIDNRSVLGYDVYAQHMERFGKLGNPEPVIASVLDIPNDQGGRVRLAWDASYLDRENDSDLVAYDIFHSVPPNAAQEAIARGASRQLQLGEVPVSGERAHFFTSLGTQQFAWEYVITVNPQHFLASYGSTQVTTGDSASGSNPTTSFMVVGRNALGSKYWLSSPAAGYSVDNLPPAAPAPFTGQYAANATQLHWNRNLEADLAGYRLYRGTSALFVPNAGSLVGALPDTGYVDVAGAPYVYKLTAVDSHGNESPVATLIPSGTLGVEAAPTALSFASPSPNPARGTTALRYALSRTGHVRLAIYDAAGRRVQMLRDGEATAGAHSESFTLRDEAGHELPSGLYLARLEAEGRVLTRRLAVIR